MKTFIKSFGALAVAAVALLACEKQEINVPSVSTKLVNFEAKSIETKTVFGEPDGTTYPTLWSANDTKVKVSLNLSSSEGYTGSAAVTPSADFKTATFSATFPEDAVAPYVFYALSPASAHLGQSESYKSWTVTIPTAQKPSATSVDEAAQILQAVSEEYETLPELGTIDFHFSHITAYGKMTLKNAAIGDATVNSVSLTFGKNVANRWYYSIADGSMSENNASNTITIETSSLTDIWFALAPVDMSGETLKVVVNTDKGTLTKEITMPANKVFKSGKIAKFAINMEGVELVDSKVYKLVTNVADLTPGSVVVIAGADTKTAISTTQNNNNRGQAAITKGDGVVLDPGEDVEIFTIEVGSVAGSYAFNASKEAGYLYAPGSGNNMRTQETIDDNASFTVTIAENGAATVVSNNATATQKYMRHNTSSSMFSCYAENSSVAELVAFYKLEGTGDDSYVAPATISVEDLTIAADAVSEATIAPTYTNMKEVELEVYSDEAHTEEGCSWLEASIANDGVVTYSAESNTTAEARTAYLLFKVYNEADEVTEHTMKLTQQGAIPEGQETVVYTLDGTVAGSGNGYADLNDITQNGIAWKVMGNTTMNPWRIGGKSLTNVERPIYSTNAIEANISKIEIEHGTASSITVNSMTVIVASDSDFSNVVSTLTPSFVANGTVTVERPAGADWSNCYYKIVYKVTVSGTSNKFVQFIGAKFTGK